MNPLVNALEDIKILVSFYDCPEDVDHAKIRDIIKKALALYSQSENEKSKLISLLEWMAKKRFAYISDDWKTKDRDYTSEMIVNEYLQLSSQSKEGEVRIRGYNCEGKKAAVSDAVEFAEWLAANSYEYMGDGKWFHDVFKEPVTARHTSEQLYNLFLEQSGQKHKPMQWIKASERLPHSFNDVYLKVMLFPGAHVGYYDDERNQFWLHSSGTSKNGYEEIKNIEWLDESTSEPIEQPTIDTLRLQQNKNYHAAVEETKRLKGLIEQFIALRKFLIKGSPLTKMMDEIIEKHNL